MLCFGFLVIYFVNDFRHWRYFDENKINVTCKQFPPMTADENNFYYRYIVSLNSVYSEPIKIEDIQLNFQSSLFINSNEIILSDIPNSSLKTKIEGNSILYAKSDSLKGGQLFAILIDCSLPRKQYLLENRAATISIKYKFFGKTHTKSFHVNPMEVMAFQFPKKEAVTFDLLKVLDNRMLPTFPFLQYDYYKLFNKSKDRSLQIYCSDNKAKLLKIKYEYPSGAIILESECPIHNDIDPIRIVVLANDDISVYSWLGKFRREGVTAQFRLGMELANKKDYKAAATAFKKVAELDPKYSEAWFNYGLSLEYAENYKSAIDAFRKAIKVKGDYSKAYYELANVLIETGKNQEATVNLQRAIKLNDKYALAYFRLGCLQKGQGKNEEALFNLNKAIMYESRADRKSKYKECLGEALGFSTQRNQYNNMSEIFY